jgi:hypothetical protein
VLTFLQNPLPAKVPITSFFLQKSRHKTKRRLSPIALAVSEREGIIRELYRWNSISLTQRAPTARLTTEDNKMKKLIAVALSLLVITSLAMAGQNTNSSTTANSNTAVKKKRGPVFRASKDQIKQAQGILKTRGFYSGEETGKLDTDTRAGLKKYQTAESIKVTGTLNRLTLEKMNIVLTDKQRTM